MSAVLILMAATAFAQTLVPGDLDLGAGPVSLTADEAIYYREDDHYIVRGKVVLISQRLTIHCDELEVWNRTGEMEARGNVVIEGAEGRIIADSVRINSRTREGVIVNSTLYIAEQHATISGERIEKIGPGSYFIQRANFTTCPCPEGKRPDWSLHARSLEAEEGGYGHLRGATFRIKDTPIFYIPFTMLPVKTERSSGFLIPRISYSSRDKLEFVLPFYWAASRWWDATIEEDFITTRGIKQNLELRWMRSETNQGNLRLFYLDDHMADENRFATVLTASQLIENRVRVNEEIRYISDDPYIRDFWSDRISEDVRARAIESRVLVAMPFESVEPYILFNWFDDLTSPTAAGAENPDRLAPQRLPRAGVRLAMINIPGTPLWGKFHSTADTFYREGPVSIWDRPGVFHGNEWAERIDIEPTVMLPYETHGFYFIPQAGFRETDWAVDESESAARHLAIAKMELGFRAWRIYRDRFKHTVEPRVRYVGIEEISPSARPRYDLTDELGDLQVLELNLDQRFYIRNMDERGTMRGQELVRFEVTQYIDLNQGEFRWARGEIEIRPRPDLVLNMDTKYDLFTGEYVYATTGTTFLDKRRDSFNLTYRFQEPNQQFIATRAEVRVTPVVGLIYFHFFDLDLNKFVDHGGGISLIPKSNCWAFEFTANYHTDPVEFRYQARFVLVGLGSAGSIR